MWQKNTSGYNLKQGTVHVWKAYLQDEQLATYFYFNALSKDEKDRADRFHFKKDRINNIVARGILRDLLARYLSVSAPSVKFKYSKYQKPFLSEYPWLQFNISHAGEYGLFAFTSDVLIGVDIEYINTPIEVENIAQRFFSMKEAQTVLKYPVNKQNNAFFKCWTRKEAFIKALGDGLSAPLDQFEVSIHDTDPVRLKAIHWNPEEVKSWSLYSLNPLEGYIGALAVKSNMSTIKQYNWKQLKSE